MEVKSTKRNLFAILVVVAVLVALVFIVSPDAEAAKFITATQDGENITISIGNTILNLNGKKNVVVKIEEGIELSVIDTSFIVDNSTIDLTGQNAGTLKVDPESTGTVAPVAFDGNFRYLRVTNDDNTYSFHPFNLTISKLGVNTTKGTICLRATFIANDVVRDILKANGSDYGVKSMSKETFASAKDSYKFDDSNSIHAYFDLTGSLNEANLDATRSYQAYMKVNGVDVLSNYIVKITPREILKALNKSSLTATSSQVTNIKTLVSNNTHLADLFTRFTGDPCSHSAKTEATCTTPNICKNCDLVSGSALGHADGAEDADTECDGCGKELSDYKEFDATELGHKINTNNVYASQGTVLGRNNVYGAVFNGTDVEVVAKTTASTRLYEDSVFGSWAEVRNNFKKKGYQYIAIDFALSEGAAITLMGSIPPAISGGASITSGLKFTAGQSLAWSSMVDTDKQKAYFSVYSEGAQINIGDTIEANKWYTVVVKLLTDVTGFKEGESSYSSVAFGLGNNKKVYFSGVRYYTNDTYMIDYLDYTEMNATEFVSYKPSTEYLTRQGNVFGRTNIYGAILSDWNVEVVPKNTVPSEIRGNQNVVYKTGSVHADWAAVRKNYETQGYQYIAMDFALSEGAKVSTIGCVPPAVQGGSVTTIGLLFADGKPLAWNKEDYTDEQKSYFVAVYSEGKQVNIDDTIEANKWYTVVIKLLVDGGKYSQGEHGWANVSFNAGNGNMVYFSNVRYYRNETFKTDFAG